MQMRTESKRSIVSLFTISLMGITTACSQSPSNQTTTFPTQELGATPSLVASESKKKVVTTFLPMYWFTKAVAGDAANVETLIPPGAEVHEYQATPENVKAISSADMLVKNGLGLEEFLEDTVKNAQNSKLKQIDASKGIQALNQISPVEKAVKEQGHEHEHEHAEGNPHVWIDPILAKQQVTNIRDGLIAVDPANKATYAANAAAYIQELDNLNGEFQQVLQKTPNCTFITFHDAYPYLAKRYNLKQVAVVEIPEDKLAPDDIQKVVNTVKKYKVKTLLGEPGTDNKLLNSLSKDLNLTLQEIDSLESGEQDPQYYFQAMRKNLKTLESACK
ncbi:MAG: zinc ABC transporter solute-binding protein [Methylacidiphilales bacterium]|nr:zinc ABC transporter solute-binding protein [Candidatus Methylacidiphilales bacterium]NJR17415.1 zinc ABC transporter solute-binding protein [Calothrix sp. CSU_2_0]